MLVTGSVHLSAQQSEADHKFFEDTKTQAEKGDAIAQYNLGVCYANGQGVAKDAVEAVKWYRKAAEQNFAEAQCNLGVCYYAGEGVTNFAVGERVMVFHHIPCGQCYYCRKQTPAQCSVYKKVGAPAGFEPSGGGFAEYIRVMDWIVRMGGVVRIPDGVPFEQAAFIEPVNTVLKAVKLLNLASDETVLVIGQGPIGVMLAALSRRTGARVLTSDLYPERHAIAANFGLHEPIQAGTENVIERTLAATEGRGADAVILAVGVDALIKTAMAAVRPGGKVMLFAQTQHGEASFDPGAVCMDEKSLLGSYSASTAIQPEVEELVFGGYRNGFDLTQLISHRFPLEEAVQAIAVASAPQADSMKIMIEPVLGAGVEREGERWQAR